MQIFARITKVDEGSRTVEGVIADETPDHAGEIFDYAKSKPNFERWSTDIAKATGGKNLGNVRAMHGMTVAGVTKELNFDDEAKAIVVKAQIVDDNEWHKTLAGCYTGFSIGGRYGAKWDDGDLKRYEAIPSEYSLVDLPCNPSAQFTVVKADGSEEIRKFEYTTDAPAKWFEAQPDDVREALRKHINSTGDLSKVASTVESKTMSDELQKSLDDTKAELAKANDTAKQAGEDLAKANDSLTKANESLVKVTAERDDLTKAVTERDAALLKAAAHINAQAELIEKMKDQPDALKIALTAIGKGDDTVQKNDEDKDKVLKADGTVNEAATAIRKALRNPVMVR